MTEGLTPEIEDFLTPLGEVGDEAQAEAEAQNGDLVSFHDHPGWTRMREYLEERIKACRNPIVKEGADPKVVGETYIRNQTVALELESIVATMEGIYDQYRPKS